MSYIALARKWRPRTFSQLVGQDHVNKALIKSLNQQRVHHAYLFSGTRGVGKTSIARLLAKSLNCEQGITAEPCLQCEACLSIEQSRFLDLIEVDAASKTRVEDTREVLENVQYAPTNGRFKIYLIDEVHMLSQHSFNALLKTLEEPPSHVKFLLATTDPQKLPVTVLSRCLQFHLKPLQPDIIVKQLSDILSAESLPFEPPALAVLAKAAQGSMRDALSLLDQAIACSNNTIAVDDVKAILGYTRQDYALQLIQALAKFDLHQLLTISRHIAIEGGNFHYVLEEMLTHLHQICIAQSLQTSTELLSTDETIISLGKQIKAEDAHLFYQIGLRGLTELHLAPTLAIGFEMTILRMHTFQPAPVDAKPILAGEKNRSGHKPPAPNSPSLSQASAAGTTPKESIHFPESDKVKKAKPLDSPDPQAEASNAIHKDEHNLDRVDSNHDDHWQTILNHINLTGLALSAAEHAELADKSKGRVTLQVANGHQALFNPAVISRIEKALSAYYKETIQLTLRTDMPVVSSPAQNKKIVQEKKQQQAEKALQNDLFFQKLQNDFSAELVKGSIRPIENDL